MEHPFTTENQILYQAIVVDDGLPELTEEQEKIVIDRGNTLSLRFLRDALRYAGKRTMRSMVRAAQASACLLLGYLHRRRERNKGDVSFLFGRIETCLGSFVEYLHSDFKGYFSHKKPMPHQLWQPVKGLVLEVIGTDAHTALCRDELLRIALTKALEENATPSWVEADYWKRITAKLAVLPRNGVDDAMHAAYILITWNFNSEHFVEYMLHRYALAIGEEMHPRQQWHENHMTLVRITVTRRYALYPNLVSCKDMLLAQIDEEMAACTFSEHLHRTQPAIALPLSVAQIGAMLRMACDAGMIETGNVSALLSRVAGMFTSKRSGRISVNNLGQKLYNPERNAVAVIAGHLHQLLKECRKHRV